MSFCAVKPPGAGDYWAIGKQGEWLTLPATDDHSYSHEWGLRTHMLITAFADHKMSSQLTNLVPVFNGTNYQQWVAAMQSFLMSQGQWKCVKTGADVPDEVKVEGNITNAAEIASWLEDAEKAMGNIRLRLHYTI